VAAAATGVTATGGACSGVAPAAGGADGSEGKALIVKASRGYDPLESATASVTAGRDERADEVVDSHSHTPPVRRSLGAELVGKAAFVGPSTNQYNRPADTINANVTIKPAYGATCACNWHNRSAQLSAAPCAGAGTACLSNRTVGGSTRKCGAGLRAPACSLDAAVALRSNGSAAGASTSRKSLFLGVGNGASNTEVAAASIRKHQEDASSADNPAAMLSVSKRETLRSASAGPLAGTGRSVRKLLGGWSGASGSVSTAAAVQASG
jgi:hypothetical protein